MHYVRIKYKSKVLWLDKEDEKFFFDHKWYFDRKGYLKRNVRRGDLTKVSTPRLHRELLNAPAEMQVDHINGNVFDNRKCNLRLATATQNARNCRKLKPNSSGFKGVYLIKSGRFQTMIRVNKKLLTLGTFDTALEAAQRYNEAARLHFGEFASLNQV